MIVQQIAADQLDRYAKIPISFEVQTVLRAVPVNRGLAGIELIKESCEPYTKDYDLSEEDCPDAWPKRFNVGEWGLFAAIENATYVGGAAVMNLNKDRAVLHDLRVQPGQRGKGIGSRLVKQVIRWSKTRNCKSLLVETQNVNVPACEFYADKGFTLETIDIQGYENTSVAHEVKLLWSMNLEE